MKTCFRKKNVVGLTFLCILFHITSALAVTTTPGPAQRPSEDKTHPTIQVKEPDFNFGVVLEGTEVEHEFTVSNTGNAVLNIERVRVS